MDKADGSIIIETKLDVSGLTGADVKKSFEGLADSANSLKNAIEDVASGSNGAVSGLEDVGDEMKRLRKETEDTTDETDQLFGKFMSANVMADIAVDAFRAAGEAIKEFVVDSIQASADIQAENAQFEQTFRDLKDTAVDSLKAIEKQTGITVSRMQGSYTKTFAFTKSIGADSEQAMDIANRAMLAAADSAAYYDKTIEEATETLQSFLKGNYENDAALGIAATETTRNAKANELYAKSFNDLSEAQKVDVLLAMVEAGNEASGAMGQAAREADSWTNVTGELNEALRQFQGVIGAPVLAGLIPIIQGITGAFREMLDVTDAEALGKNMESISKGWENAEKQFSETKKEVSSNSEVAKIYLQRLKDLEAAGLKTSESQKQYAAVVEALNELMPDLNLYIDEQTGLTNLSTEAIEFQIEAMKRKAMFAAYEEKYTAALKVQADAAVTAREAERELYEVQEDKNVLIQQLGGTMEEYRDRLAETERQLQFQLSATGANVSITQDMIYAAAGLTAEQIAQYESLVQLTAQEGQLRQTIDEANSVIAQQDDVLRDVSVAMGEITEETGKAAEEVANDVDVLGQLVGERLAEKIVGNTEAVKKAFAALARAGLESFEQTVNRGGRVTSAGNNYEVSFGAYSLERSMPDSTAGGLPYLADGAAIPPNAPFAAILGDQSNGMNLEAPEGLIRQIIQEEMTGTLGGMMAGFEAVVDRLDVLTDVVGGIEVGDDTIGKANRRYIDEQRTIGGGW